MNIKQKKGISLIVLVITIIVMIILATAIILALNGSGIIGKAHEARTNSDTATLLEAATILSAEWDLESKLGNITEDAKSYITNGLRDKGFTDEQIAKIEISETGVVKEKVLTKIAESLLKAGIPIGASVTGYDVSGNETSYTTDGTENSHLSNGNEATAPQPQTVQVSSEIKWTYMGVSDDGEALIVMNLDTADTDKTIYSYMTLGGKNGYLNGVDSLNKACKALYSTAKGEARSINFEDVLKVLKYNGPIAQYTDVSGTVIKTNSILTVKEVISDTNILESKFNVTPDGTDIMKYKADTLTINVPKEDDYIKADPAAKAIIFTLNAESKNWYWIADRANHVGFKNKYVEFGIRSGDNENDISAYKTFSSVGPSYNGFTQTCALRPVVELKGDLTYTYDANTNTITLN